MVNHHLVEVLAGSIGKPLVQKGRRETAETRVRERHLFGDTEGFGRRGKDVSGVPRFSHLERHQRGIDVNVNHTSSLLVKQLRPVDGGHVIHRIHAFEPLQRCEVRCWVARIALNECEITVLDGLGKIRLCAS